MSNFLDLIDKYKFGLIAALTAYVMIFMYLQMSSYTAVIHYEPFHDGARVEIPPEEIELLPENIMVPPDMREEVSNTARDANDDRERAYENYSPTKSVADIEAEYRELEQQMYADAGGDKTRDEIRKEIEQRKQQDLNAAQNNPQPNNTTQPSDFAAKGSVMVEWDVKDRTPHQNNAWHVRNPGYTCENGARGYVVVNIKVNQSGSVTSATYSPSESTSANSCMIEKAIEYAKKSRFNYSSSAPSAQSGKIMYNYVP